MDVMAILALVAKGVSVISALISAGESAAPAIEVVKNLITGAQKGSVTPEQLAQTEALLDSMIDDFNLELPEP